ncbi:MAG TPA: M20/M25/M40 family metallo-hydrolase [Gemmataceae bacterium]|nr:M20/M25/M40 family metallo-hydrolase [Gemmataceae bacterium]
MTNLNLTIDSEKAITRLMRFLAIEGITGQERAIAEDVVRALIEAGVPKSAIRFDDANQRIPVPTQTGNIIVNLPGTRPGPRLLFMCHLDTVPLGAGAKPVRKVDRIVPAGETALGGDNRTGCAVLVTLAATLMERKLPHPPLTLFFTVREESGLYGAKHVDPKDLHGPVFGFNFDGKCATEICIGAVGAERWQAEITGKASHAGVHPEKGISATMVMALALTDVFRGGWFGKVVQGEKTGTSNVGRVGDAQGHSAGQATNVVTDFIRVNGESRSHDLAFASAITAAYRAAFEKAAGQVKDAQGATATVKFESKLDYYPFRLSESDAVYQHAQKAIAHLGWPSVSRIANGGLDANWLVRHGIPTVTLGAGQNEIHTKQEFVDLAEFARGCQVALALATVE